jgi:hypothetical protein
VWRRVGAGLALWWVYWDVATGLVVVFNSGCGFAGGVVVDVLYAIITICIFVLLNHPLSKLK